MSISDDVWVVESDESRLQRYTWTASNTLLEVAYPFDEAKTGRVLSFATVDNGEVVLGGAKGLLSST